MEDIFKRKSFAEKRAEELGCEGIHKHKGGFMPCSTHKKYEEKVKANKSKEEMEEIIDFDGTMNNSKIPILDPRVTNKGTNTMDKTVAMTRITQDPLMRGYRVYYGESLVREEDMENAFGYEETNDMNAEETIDYFIKELGFDKDDAEERAVEMGKDPDIPDNPELKDEEDFIDTMRLVEKKFTKKDIIQMSEDLLVKKSEDKDIKKKTDDGVSPILLRNIKALKNQADVLGLSDEKLIRLIKNEQ